MRVFVTPSILISVIKRSKGLTHVFGGSFDAAAQFEDAPRNINSVTARGITAMAQGGNAASAAPAGCSATSTLGLDPKKCTADEIRHQLRRRGYSAGKRTKAQLLGELQDLVRAESFAPPDPAVTGMSEETLVAVSGEAQRRWSSDAGWVDPANLETGPGGNALCRFCDQEIPSNRRTFCSNACVHEHKIRTQGGYVRKSLLYRDGGKCAECGVDAYRLYQLARKAWAARESEDEKREAVAREVVGTPFEGKVPREGSTKRPTAGMFWHADHIVPVVKGGGQCSLRNYRTLCVPCHAVVTKRLAADRAAERARTDRGATDLGDGGGERRANRRKKGGSGKRAAGGNEEARGGGGGGETTRKICGCSHNRGGNRALETR